MKKSANGPRRPGLAGLTAHAVALVHAARWNSVGQAPPYGSLASRLPLGPLVSMVSDSEAAESSFMGVVSGDAEAGGAVGGFDYSKDPNEVCEPTRSGLGGAPGAQKNDMTLCGLNGSPSTGHGPPLPGDKRRKGQGSRPCPSGDCDGMPSTLSLTDFHQRIG